MPAQQKTRVEKAKKYTRSFPAEFLLTQEGDLWCKLCLTNVSSDRKSTVDKHRNSAGHQGKLKNCESQASIKNFNLSEKSFPHKVTMAFLAADIPLYKLRHPALRKLFQDIGNPLPSEFVCRNIVKSIGESIESKIIQVLKEDNIFMVVDEAEINGKKIAHVLIGTIENPAEAFLIECIIIGSSPNASMVCQIIDDVFKKTSIDRKRFILLLSDAAPYMISAGKTLKNLFPRLFHVTCLSHLLHNCALKIKSKFQSADAIIATIKAATIKNKIRESDFSNIGKPPAPIVTRWGSWLEACLFYAKNLPLVRTIVNSWDGDGILIRRAKEAVNDPDAANQLFQIFKCYSEISKIIIKLESSELGIAEAVELLNIDFKEDPCEIRKYISRRLESNDITPILKMQNVLISPAEYSFLFKCQPTTASVERSFSILGKLLQKDRNFNAENIKYYMLCLFNSSIISKLY